MKKIAFITTARSEFNASRWVIKAINDDPDFELQLLVGGTHWGKDNTYKEIEKDHPAFWIGGYYNCDSPENACISMGETIANSDFFKYEKPDLVIINGDRLELMSFIIPAILYKIPICHIGGGEITEGSSDNENRYAISRFAHLHLVSCQESANNLIQSGEELDRVFVVGQCGLENIMKTKKLSLRETSRQIGLDLSQPTALCIYYPAREKDINVENQILKILFALDESKIQTVFVYPCAEIGSDIIRNFIDVYCKTHDNCKVLPHLENQLFQSILQHCSFMIGNSSAGVIEAPFLNKWSINVGNRQSGRIKNDLVFNVSYHPLELKHRIKWCTENSKPLKQNQIEYPSKKIVQIIKEYINRPDLLYKKILLGGTP